jgi:CRP-like cAMP-binding protein
MSAKKALKELEERAAREPKNLALRLRLAAALRAVGRRDEGTELVRSVALAYHAEGRLVQALAVCRSLLEIEPGDLITRALYADIEAARTGAPGEDPTQFGYRGASGSGPHDAPVTDTVPDDPDLEPTGAAPAPAPAPPTLPGTEADSAPEDDAVDTAPQPLVELADASAAGLPFASLPIEAQRVLVERRIARSFGPGDLIVREGDPGESCFVLASGHVQVIRRDAERAGETVEVARMGPGELFGEFALLADRRRHATVQAVDRVLVYELPRRVFRELAAAHPAVAASLERLYRERLLENLVGRSPFFRLLPASQRLGLAARFAFARFEAGQAIVREGDRGGGFYLVVLGSVEITKRAGERGALLLATLREGQFFGEMSLLSGTLASATVTATGPTELAELPRREFYEVLSAHPALWEELRREARRRELATENILAGETSVV